MKKSKVLLLLLCTVALSMAAAFGTLAYLTDSEAVTNTVTVGQVHITLDEENVDKKDASGNDNASELRDTANKYHLIPGQTYTKDPIVHVQEGSESCWVYVKVENGISDIECDDADYVSVAAQIAANGWAPLDGVTNVYYQLWDKEKDKGARDLEVFENFKIDGEKATNEEIAKYETATKGTVVKVTAYAIQAAGFDTAFDAWDTAKGQFS